MILKIVMGNKHTPSTDIMFEFSALSAIRRSDAGLFCWDSFILQFWKILAWVISICFKNNPVLFRCKYLHSPNKEIEAQNIKRRVESLSPIIQKPTTQENGPDACKECMAAYDTESIPIKTAAAQWAEARQKEGDNRLRWCSSTWQWEETTKAGSIPFCIHWSQTELPFWWMAQQGPQNQRCCQQTPRWLGTNSIDTKVTTGSVSSLYCSFILLHFCRILIPQ